MLRLRHLVSLALLCAIPVVSSALPPDPVIFTIDGRHYVTYAVPVNYFPADRLIVAPDTWMGNCRRGDGSPAPAGIYSLVYSSSGDEVAADSLALHFGPTRFVLATATGDVVCDGEASGWQTGIGRIFRGHFESP